MLLVAALLLPVRSVSAAPTTWSCMQRGGLVTYTQASSYRPVCTNLLTFTVNNFPGGDPQPNWTVQSTSTQGTLPSWYVGPWEPSQDITITAVTLSQISGPACHMFVGSTYSGDPVLDAPIMPAETHAVGGLPVLLFPGIYDAPPGPPAAYLDLHGYNCPAGSYQILMIVKYVPEGAVPVPPGAVVWNPSDKSALIALSNGNLSAAGSGGAFGSVRATVSYSTGKYHWENQVTAATGSTSVTGFGTSAMSLASYVGSTVASAGIQASGQTSANGFSCVAAGVTWVAGDVESFEVDLDAHKAWLGKNGTWVAGGNPAAGTSPWCAWSGTLALFPAWSSAGNVDTGTARFKASAFTTAVSTGFLPWDPN